MQSRYEGPYRVYGTEDATGGDELLIITDKYCNQIHIYITSGFDYGSGIRHIKTCDDSNAYKIYAILEKYTDYDMDKAVKEIIKL